ncbi:MAG: hypothetical protein AAFX54_18020 [Pseudomonadota bacterium]
MKVKFGDQNLRNQDWPTEVQPLAWDYGVNSRRRRINIVVEKGETADCTGSRRRMNIMIIFGMCDSSELRESKDETGHNMCEPRLESMV